ncbi:ATP-binding protein [Massilia sp. UMI-21]|nr:ATP-binding protein [Massilia sp. UMI-21]
MSDDTLQPVGGLLAGFGPRLAMVVGTCPQHGEAEALTRVGAEWQCPQCLEMAMAADTRAKWLQTRAADLMATASIPAKYVGQRFIASTDEQRAVLRTVQLYRDFILKELAWAALIMVGTTGTGKTLLACQLAQSLISKASRSIRYITAAGMISEIQATYGREGKSEEAEIMRFAQYDVLILDEIDAIRATENANLLLTEIINRRYNEAKPVIVISNQPFDNLARYVGERVHSRLHEHAFVCDFRWADARRAGGAQPALQVVR